MTNVPILTIQNASVNYGAKPIFENISLSLSRLDRVCLIGRNGAGKSTLIKMIIGEIELDKGERYIEPGVKIGYLPQEVVINNFGKVYDYVLSDVKLEPGETITERYYLADMVLEPLGIPGEKPIKTLSGGKVRRMALAKALLDQPDLLLLDEPTNHLDLASIKWLEEFFQAYKGAIICISHDRRFLENVSNKVFWLDNGELRVNDRGFKYFDEWQEEIEEQELKAVNRIQQRLKAEEHWLQRGVTARRKRNQQRLAKLMELRKSINEERSKLSRFDSSVDFGEFESMQASKLCLELDNISFQYEDVTPPKQVINNFTARVIKGEKIGVIGRNGGGKTTLLRIITGQTQPSKGTIKRGAKLEISYFDQNRQALDLNKTPWQTMCPSGGDQVKIGNRHKHVVAYLKNFLFRPDQVDQANSLLSGGEASRLMLAKILANPGNLLILDEPTNDLDMDSLDKLQDILLDYQGTLLVVSHDRDFLDKIVTRSWVFEENGKIVDCNGGYSDYSNLGQISKEDISPKNKPKASGKSLEKKKSTIKFSYKYKYELDQLPGEIEKLSAELGKLQEKLQDPGLYQDKERLLQVNNKIYELQSILELKEARWLYLEELKGED